MRDTEARLSDDCDTNNWRWKTHTTRWSLEMG
jgi:hypothetical protein